MEVNNITKVTNQVNNNDKTNQTSSAGNTSFSDMMKSQSVSPLEDIFNRAAAKYGVDVNLLKAIAKQESDFQPNCTSHAGAMGIMQLMPDTAKGLGVTDPYDPEQNIMGGAKFISQMLKKYDGDVTLALAAYNAGPNNVAKYGGVPPFKETQDYVKKVTTYYKNGVTVPSGEDFVKKSSTHYDIDTGKNVEVTASQNANVNANSLLEKLNFNDNSEKLLNDLRELLNKLDTSKKDDTYSLEEYARFMRLYLDGIAIDTISKRDTEESENSLTKQLSETMDNIRHNLEGAANISSVNAEDAVTTLSDIAGLDNSVSDDEYYAFQQISYSPAVLNLLNNKKNN
ncbi:MAG: lytic transglycosylase domain-containing protein [Lachnospiraceae bacterium]|nr:lytic transglycosylase domain-containing protein [Lachnospiraceae bacterium]